MQNIEQNSQTIKYIDFFYTLTEGYYFNAF